MKPCSPQGRMLLAGRPADAKQHLDRQDRADQHSPAGRRATSRLAGTRAPSSRKPSSLSNPECSHQADCAHTEALTARDPSGILKGTGLGRVRGLEAKGLGASTGP